MDIMSAARVVLFCVITVAVVNGQHLNFSPRELPWAIVDQTYIPPPLTVLGAAKCLDGDTNFTADGLPPGLTITGTGQIEGVPQRTGTYRVAIRAANSCDTVVKPATLFVTGAPILLVSADTLEFHYRRGGPQPRAQTITVSGSWPNLDYSFGGKDAAWVRAAPRRGRTPRVDASVTADYVEVSVVPADLAPGTHETQMKVSTWLGVNAHTVTVRLVIE